MLSSFYGLSRLQWLALNLRVCSLSALLSLMSQTKIKKAKRGGGEDMKNVNQVMSKTKANWTLVWFLGLITEHSAHAQTHKHAQRFWVSRGGPNAEGYKGPHHQHKSQETGLHTHTRTHTAGCDKKKHRGHTSLISVYYDFRTNDRLSAAMSNMLFLYLLHHSVCCVYLGLHFGAWKLSGVQPLEAAKQY